MKFPGFLKRKKFWKRFFLYLFIVPVFLFSILVGIVYWQQDAIVQRLLGSMNEDFKGSIEIKDSHVSLFANFPYISIDLEGVVIYEDKTKSTKKIVDVKDIYLGFDIWTIISGKMEIKKIKISDGTLNLVQHKDGVFNIVKALETEKEVEDPNEEFHLDLKEIELVNVDVFKYNEASDLIVESFIDYADARFKTSPDHVYASLNSKFLLNVISGKDTTVIKHKHFDVNTELDFITKEQKMTLLPSVVKLEGAEFNMKGEIDFLNEVFVDFTFSGHKPNFDLFIAMAPEELIPVLKKYDNKGRIFFDARMIGKTANGHKPFIKADFGCEDAYFNNFSVHKKLDDLNFKGYFTNGVKRDITTMEFNIENFSAKPEAGKFSGKLNIKNFASPEIQMQIDSDFELEFLAKFLNLRDLENLRGKVHLSMNFNDIIDFEHPERSISKLNESYFTELKIERLSFNSPDLPAPIKKIDLHAVLNGHEAKINYGNFKIGKSDISINGTVSDLPALLHHTNITVVTDLVIKSKYLDLFELTGSDSLTSFDEQISNLSLNLKFKSSAKQMTESPNLPVGEFFIENLFAKLKHYPHTLHDFHADVFIDKEDFRVVDFKGMIDRTDFLFSGKLSHYDLWFAEHPAGDTRIDFNLVSELLQLEDIFAYQGANYVPEDYRHEEIKGLKLHGITELHFKDGLKSIDLNLDRFDGKMKVHPLKFENFNGRVHYESEHLVVENFSGKMGKSDFKTTLHYYLGDDETVRKRDNHFEITSTRLDFDELFNYEPVPTTATAVANHDAGFNIYTLPFTNMTYDINIGHLNYHRYLLHEIAAKMRTTKNHYIHFDKLHLQAAGGTFDGKGYFNGSNPDKIYFSPDLNVKNVDLDKLLFKFENFGQDHIVSENLHGKFSGHITGKIHMHNDLVPKIDDSEIHMDINVLNGRLENFVMFDYMADYFQDKNLKKVYFDTLVNHIDLTNGVLNIPNMSINSSIGFLQISGKQDMNLNMDYHVKIPWKMITEAASSKLFGKKSEEVDPEQIDAIQYADAEKKIRYLNVRITGTPETYKISVGKKKKQKK